MTNETHYQWLAQSIPKKLVSPTYQMSLVLVGFAVFLLPLFYVALCIGGLWLLYELAYSFYGLTALGIRATLCYIVLVGTGAFAWLFLVKPLFSSPWRNRAEIEVKRESEPLLFQFIDEVCDRVGAPRSVKIYVDNDVNASAAFENGIWDLLSQRLVLRIGLPLVGGFSVSQLGGVIAHELGHFSQSVGLRLSCLIRSINMWFTRLVYERSGMDRDLDDWFHKSDGLDIVLSRLVVVFVLLSRGILWLLMKTGQILSGHMSRQMEFDADRYGRLIGGQKNFETQFVIIETVSEAQKEAIPHIRSALKEGKRLDNHAQLIQIMLQKLSPEKVKTVQDKILEDRKLASWDSTHPTHYQRIQHPCETTAGILVGDQPSSVLFSNFEATCKLVTLADYFERFRVKVEGLKEVTAQEYLDSIEATSKRLSHLDDFYAGVLTARLLSFPELSVATQDIQDDLVLIGRDEAKSNLKQFEELEKRREQLITARYSQELGISTDSHASQEKLYEEYLQTTEALKGVEDSLRSFQKIASDKLIRAAMRSKTPTSIEQVTFLANFLSLIQPIDPILQNQYDTFLQAKLIFQNIEVLKRDTLAIQKLQRLCISMRGTLHEVDTIATQIPFPFQTDPQLPHLARYLVNSNATDYLNQDFNAMALLRERYANIYFQVMLELMELCGNPRELASNHQSPHQ